MSTGLIGDSLRSRLETGYIAHGSCSLPRVVRECTEVVVSAHTIQICFRATGGHLRRFKLNVSKSRAARLSAFSVDHRCSSRHGSVLPSVAVSFRKCLISSQARSDMSRLPSANFPTLRTRSRNYTRRTRTNRQKCERGLISHASLRPLLREDNYYLALVITVFARVYV